MPITIVAVGRLKSGPLAELCADYRRRLPLPLELHEVEERRPLAGPERKAREGALILSALPKGALVVALDERGKSYDSAGFARQFAAWREASGDQLAFVLGGADGLDQAVLAASRARLALGSLTWPHMLARAMLLEQIYRAHTILTGHPYHRA
ncbi:MAG: 23S rRNA (pseudouridine(1915)-N(3))-methyltransferase RlmH [Rhodospirillaceae bacterium]|nr:23S rRNA (pseudouridine(1915)-N(3))-methyltransferase RlmH [Rhodospirillaceae bacterium]